MTIGEWTVFKVLSREKRRREDYEKKEQEKRTRREKKTNMLKSEYTLKEVPCPIRLPDPDGTTM
jgi:hypothetical protein